MSDMITDEEAAKLLDGTTPGPWKVCETTIHGRKYGGCWVEGPDVDDGDGRPQGLLIPITGSGGSMSYTTRLVDIQGHDHNDANAHLIAAAPDLARSVIALHARLAAAEGRVAALTKERDEAVELAEERLRGQHRLSNQLNDTARKLNARLAALQEALEFYANKEAWNQPPVQTREGLLSIEYENQASKVQSDRGKIARAALNMEAANG